MQKTLDTTQTAEPTEFKRCPNCGAETTFVDMCIYCWWEVGTPFFDPPWVMRAKKKEREKNKKGKWFENERE